MKRLEEYPLMKHRQRKGTLRYRRVIDPRHFAAMALNLPAVFSTGSHRSMVAVTGLIAAGIAMGALWPQASGKPEPKEEIFVFEEEIPSPLPEPPPPPPDPEPPPAKVEAPPEESLPPPQFGMEEDALSETGDLAAATGNTLMKEADTVVAPPPPPLPPAPIFLNQPPRILSGPAPEYPARALDRGLEGTVIALIAIDTTGRVSDVEIERSDGWEFTESVRKAVRRMSFAPPRRTGRPVACKFRRAFEFRLET